MIDVIFGESAISPAARALIDSLSSVKAAGTLFLGYPILVTSEGTTDIDALLTSKDFGLVAFDLKNSNGDIEDDDYLKETSRRQDEIYAAISSKLLENRELVHGRRLALDVNVVTVHHDSEYNSEDGSVVILPANAVPKYLTHLLALDDHLYEVLNSVIQRTTTLRPKKRRSNVTVADSKGAIVKTIDREIANLDTWQKRVAIEFPDAPQRIRGLAGSGKTIVLAQKASFLHNSTFQDGISIRFTRTRQGVTPSR
jgi:superfamily I DNA and RNA helicase